MVCMCLALGALRSGGSYNFLMWQSVSTTRMCREEGPVCCLGLSNWNGDAALSGGVDVWGRESHGRQAQRFRLGGWIAGH